MSRMITIFLNMIQSLDVCWRVFATFLSGITALCLALFVFFPLFLSLLQMLLGLLQKGLILITGFCMKTWGKLVIRWRKKAGKYPQSLVSTEDFFVSVITGISNFFEKINRWKPAYGAIGVRVVLISVIFTLLLSLTLWILPGPGQILTAFYMDWEREYVIGQDQPASAIVETLQKNRDMQLYYKLSDDSANLRETPDGEVIGKINDDGQLIRYLGESEGQWHQVEVIDNKKRVKGWIHASMVTRWEVKKNSLARLNPGSNIRISASGVQIFTCEFLGLEQAEDGTVTLILEAE